jgi:outer membrane protein assembly factor BamB
VFDKGTVIISAVNNATSTGGLWAIDAQTQETRWSQSKLDVLFSTPAIADGIVYVPDNAGNIWAFQAASPGQMQWRMSYQAAADPSVLRGQLIVTTQDGRIVALELDDGLANWTYDTGVSVVDNATSPILSGRVVIASVANTVYALDVVTGALLWDYTVGGALSGTPSASSSTVYFACQDGFLYAVDVTTGDLNWQWPSTPLASVPSAPIYYNGAVYLGDPGGNFYAVHAETGAGLWQIGLTGHIGALGLAIEDGIAYVAAGKDDGTAMVYGIDLQSEGQEIVSYDPSGSAFLFGVETGVCYLVSGSGNAMTTVGVVNIAGMFHQFFCESELMVEDYARNPTTGQAQGNSTSFRTQVALFDPNRNPRGGKSVKVWASGPVTITSGGQSYDVDAASTGKTAWLQTDGAGELSIVATASGITMPALYLWANFMDLPEAIVIYPDYDTLNRLSGVQGSDLAQGTTYDGSPLLPSSYTQADDLASTIRNAIGNTASAVQQMRLQSQPLTKSGAAMRSNTRADVARSYLAYPQSTPNMIYQATMGPPDRAYVPGAIQSWQANFDSAGGVTFSTGGTLAAQLPPGNIFDDIGDFINNVVNGAANVVQIVWDEAQTIVDDAKNIYNIAIKTVQDAAAVVAGVLKTVVGDIAKALQWLSYLFDWNEYLATKDQIKNIAQQGFSNLQTWVDNQLTGGVSAVHTFFQNAENSVASDLSWVQSLIGGNSLQSQQQSQNNPQSVYGLGGGKSYTKSRWLTDKYSTNAGQATLGDSSSPVNDIISGVQQLYNTVLNVLDSPQFNALPADIKKVFNDFSLLATDPSDFITKSFNDIIGLVSDLAVTLLQFADAILEAFLQAVKAIVDALFDLLNTPLDIPVLSDLYSMITEGSQLTVLDLCCLIVSIPATIITKALSAAGAVQRVGSAQGVQYGLLAGALAIYTILDAPMNLDPETPPPLKLGYAALCLIIQGLSFPSDLASNTAGSYIFFGLTTCPVVFASLDFASSLGLPVAFLQNWEAAAPIVNTAYGIVLLIASILLARSSTQFVGEANEVLVQNIFSSIGFIPKPCAYFGEDGRAVLAVIDGVSDLTVTGLEIAQASQAS